MAEELKRTNATWMRLQIVVLLAITALGAWLRFAHLDAKSLWIDEGSSVAISRLDWWNFLRILWRREGNMAFYYLLLRGWLAFGSSEVAVRSLSALAGALAIVAIYFLGKKLWNGYTGLWAALLLSVNAFHISYSRDARGYALAVLLLTLSTILWIDVVRQPSRKNSWLYSICSAFAVYSHFYSGLVLLAQWVSAWFAKLDADKKREARQAITRTLYFLAPAIVFVATTGTGPLAWITRPNVSDLRVLALEITGGGGNYLLIFYAVALILFFVSLGKHGGASNPKYSAALILCWLLLPPALIFALSFIKPLWAARFMIVSLPALCLCAGAGLANVKPKLLGAIAGAGVVFFSAGALRGGANRSLDIPTEEWRSAAHFVLQQSMPQDGVIFYSSQCRMPFDFYTRGAANAPRVLFPAHEHHLSYLDFMGKPDSQFLSSLPAQAPTIWLVMCHNTNGSGFDGPTQTIRNALEKNYKLEEARAFPGVDVERYHSAGSSGNAPRE